MKGYSFGELVKLAEAALPRTDNAVSASKLFTARYIGGVSFDGTANINLPGVNQQGNQNTSGNAATATKLQTARTINGTNFDGTGNITTANWGTARTLTIGNSGKSVNGGGNVSWSLAEIGAARARGELASGPTENITTAQFVQWLKDSGAFNERVWIVRGEWTYAQNKTITDTGCGNIHLSGCTIEVISGNERAYTIRIITPTTTSGGGTTGAEFVYVDNGPSYLPGWRRIYTTAWKPNANDVGALPITGGTLTGPVGVNTNGKTVLLGNGSSDVFIHNSKSNKYLQLKDDGTLKYSDQSVYHQGFKPTAADVGALPSGGTAVAATKLATPRQINGTNFDGTVNITTANWGTSRNLTIGNTTKAVNGSTNVSWSLSELGAVNRAGDVMAGALHGKVGSVAPGTPNSGFVFEKDSDTGLFSARDGNWQLGNNGNPTVECDSGSAVKFYKQIRAPKGAPNNQDGSANAGFAFNTDGDTGLFAEGGGVNSESLLTLRNDNEIVATFPKNNASFAPNGYTRLPNGLIIQWGAFVQAETGAPVSFTWNLPIAFPSKCLQAFLTIGDNLTSHGTYCSSVESLFPTSVGGFTVGPVGPSTANRNYRIFAIGR